MVMTNGGIYGAIAEVDGEIIWLEVAPDVELKIMKSSISDRAPEDTGTDTDDDHDAHEAHDAHDASGSDDDAELADKADKADES